LNTADSHEHVLISNTHLSVEDILGDVIVRNTSPGGFTDLTVENQGGANAASAVTVSDTAIVGLAPAVIRYDNSSIDELTGFGGKSDTTYSPTGSLRGSDLGLGIGSGKSSLILGNEGRVNPGLFPGSIFLVGGGTDSRLIIDDSAETAARDVAFSNEDIAGL